MAVKKKVLPLQPQTRGVKPRVPEGSEDAEGEIFEVLAIDEKERQESNKQGDRQEEETTEVHENKKRTIHTTESLILAQDER